MKMRTLFLINAVFQLIFGLGFLLAPAVLLGLFGTKTDTTGITLAHVAGGVILSLAIISWLGKDAEGSGCNRMGWSLFCAPPGWHLYLAGHPEWNFQRAGLVRGGHGRALCHCIFLGARK